MLDKDTAAHIDEIAGKVEFEGYEEIKFVARDLASKIDNNKSQDNMLWVMCLRLTGQILADSAKSQKSVHEYLSSDKYLT